MEEEESAGQGVANHSGQGDIQGILDTISGDNEVDELKKQIGFPSRRHVFTLLATFGFFNVYAMRVNLNVALVAMVNSTSASNVNGTPTSDECPWATDNGTRIQKHGEFEWNGHVQGLILSAFYYGYTVTQLPGGRLAERFGGKLVFGCGVLCTTIFTLLTPLAARWSPYAMVAVRVLEGVGEGVTFPAMHALLSKWAPPMERSVMGTWIYAGAQIGTVVSMPVSGLLSDHVGWQWAFYIFGILGVVWYILWLFLVHNSPGEHPRISLVEKEYIENAIGDVDAKKIDTIPWREIVTSIPMWGLACAHVSYAWGYLTLLTMLPTYMKEVLHFNISSNGVLSALPYVFLWVTMVAGGQVADYLRYRRVLSTGSVRKLFHSLGAFIGTLGLIVASFAGCNTVLAVTMVTIAGGTGGFTMSGWGVNHIDLAPALAGTLMGITNTLGNIPGFLAPQVAGAFTYNNHTSGGWRKVFLLSAGLFSLGAIAFIVLGSGERQPWACPEYLEAKKKEKETKENATRRRSNSEIM